MFRKHLLLGAVATSLALSGAAVPAFAKGDAAGEGRHHPRHARMIERLDTNKDGKVSLDEMKADVAASFKAFDTDGNGVISKAEIDARRDAFKDARKAVRDASADDKAKAREAMRAGGPYMIPGAGRMFDRVDTDKSGSLSEAEVMAAAEKMFERRDRNGDGSLDRADFRKGKGGERHAERRWHHGKGGEQRAERMMKFLDTNGDGKISSEEMLARANATFDRFDTNKDGTVTKAEVDAKREAFRDARKAFREVRATGGEARDAARTALRDARRDRMGAGMFERADLDKNGALTKSEMESASAAMFKKRDRNGDGFISADEIGKPGK